MNKLIETSAESKAKKLFTNPSKSGYIKTFAIFTANNPDAEQTTRKNNISLNKGLKRDMKFDIEKELNNGYWSYYKVKGKYGNVENSFIIYNITLTDAKELSAKYHQQSFIYGTNEDGKLTFAFYANRSKSNYDYVKVDEKDSFNILDKDAENYYTQISRDFKFSIPFDVFEVAADQMIEELEERKEQIKWSENDIVECIKNSLDEKKTNTHKYQCRATLKNKDKTKYTFMADPEEEASFFNNAMGSAVAENLKNIEKQNYNQKESFNMFKFKLVESIDEKVKLHYDDLLYEIAVDFDKDTNAYSYEEKHNPFDYEVDKEKVIDVLYDICIGKKEFDNYSEEEIEDHIRNCFNNVLKTYYTDVLNEFEEDAKQKAEYDYYEEQENVYYDSLEEDKNNTTQKDKSKEFSVFEDIKTGLEQAIDYEKAN